MARLINLKLLADFFNKMANQETFPGLAHARGCVHSPSRMAAVGRLRISVETKRPTSSLIMTDLEALAASEPGSDPDGEIRHLKSTIAALRQALEDGEAERAALRQKVRAAYERHR